MIRIQADAARQSGKDRNATLLFDLVRRLAPISRAELAKTSGLSPATVTVLVDELLQGGWLVELGVSASEERRGRRPVNLAINARRGAVATLEITGGGYILSVYDICLGKLAHHDGVMDERAQGGHLVALVQQAVGQLHGAVDAEAEARCFRQYDLHSCHRPSCKSF